VGAKDQESEQCDDWHASVHQDVMTTVTAVVIARKVGMWRKSLRSETSLMTKPLPVLPQLNRLTSDELVKLGFWVLMVKKTTTSNEQGRAPRMELLRSGLGQSLPSHTVQCATITEVPVHNCDRSTVLFCSSYFSQFI
jgi:hypothetical protein